MAEENKPGRSDGRGNRRRRYFKRRSDKAEGAQSATPQAGGAQASPGTQQGAPRNQGGGANAGGQAKGQSQQNKPQQITSASAESGRARGVRKRRRSRARRGEFRTETPISTEHDVAYVAPSNVFVYTHVARPSSRESYEFRSEHFSKHGHTLEDYTIDLSVIFDAPRPDFGAGVAKAFEEMEARGDVATEARFQQWIEHADPEAFAAANALAAANAAANAGFADAGAISDDVAAGAGETSSPLAEIPSSVQQVEASVESADESGSQEPLVNDDRSIL